ncbi:MAG: hypothetical protein HQK50_19570 [Oligoflexia bacterium]|nr:hypothetical protein [Oligoflexia bacterium]MBF0367776.1 hypothetical protein [Oligoflexia bacterium]
MRKRSQFKLNFLLLQPIQSIVMSAAFPIVLQILALSVFFCLAINGLGIGGRMRPEELMLLRKTNLTTLVVWGIWWPCMIAIALFFGRAWCMICPMELINRVGDAIARKIGWPRAKLGALLRAGWMTVTLYFILQLLVASISIHRVPHFTSIMLLTLLFLALITGFIFSEQRSFCKAFCPSTALISVYGRYTPIQLETCNPSVCSDCRSKDCVSKNNHYRFDKSSCPSLLVPYHRHSSDGCVLCLQCAKICPSQNMGFGIVSSEAGIRRKTVLKPFEAAFVMIALGFVTHELVGEVPWLEKIFHIIPEQLNAFVPFITFGLLEAIWFLFLFPLMVWTLVSSISYLAGNRAGLKSIFLFAATGAAPIVAVAHLAKAMAKITSWGGYLPFALQDPKGIQTFHNITNHDIVSPAAIIGLPLISWIILAAMLFITWRSFNWVRTASTEDLLATRIGLITSTVLFTMILSVWSFSTR